MRLRKWLEDKMTTLVTPCTSLEDCLHETIAYFRKELFS